MMLLGLLVWLIGPLSAQERLLAEVDLLSQPVYRSMEEAMKAPDQVVRLQLEGVKNLPDDLKKLKNLQWLDLSGGKLKELPGWLKGLRMLQVLNLYGNPLTNFPEVLTKCAALRRLNLANCKLLSLPKGLGKLANLEELYLANNRLSQLPDDFAELAALHTLTLQGNRFQPACPEVVQRLAQLRHLEMDFRPNMGRHLADIAQSLPQLTDLALFADGAHRLPPEIVRMQQLQSLDLVGLDTLFSWEKSLLYLASLPKLERLALDHCSLKEIHPNIGRISELRELVLWGNELTELPTAFYEGLLKLRKLHLEGNPIADAEREKIKSWFRIAEVHLDE